MERSYSSRWVSVVFVAGLLSIIIPLAGNHAIAGKVSWVSAVSGNWSDGTKWSEGVKPSSGDDVLITVDGTYTVTLDDNATVTSLTLGGTTGTQTLTGSGRTLTLDGPSTIGSYGRLSIRTVPLPGLAC